MKQVAHLPESGSLADPVENDRSTFTSLARLITAVTTRFINLPPDDIDEGIIHALGLVGRFTQVDRSIVILEQDGHLQNVYEWRQASAAAADGPNNIRFLPSSLPWLMEQLNRAGVCQLGRVDQLPPEAQREKAAFAELGLRALLAVALVSDHKVIGYLSLMSFTQEREWREEDADLLQVVGDIFTNALQRKGIELRERLAYEIGARLANLLNLDDLSRLVIEQLRNSLGYYHIQIFLADGGLDGGAPTAVTQLILHTGSGVIGERMKRRGHTIPLDAARSIVARAARSQETLIVNDVRRSTYHLPNPALPKTRSEVAIPMLAEQTLIGVLDIQHTDPNYFNEHEIRILQIIANQLSTAVARAHLFARNGRLVDELTLLHAVATVVTEATNEDALFHQVTAIVAPAIQCDSFGFSLIDRESGSLNDHISYRYRDGKAFLPTIRPGEGITGHVVNTGKPWRIGDVSREPAFIGDLRTRSEVCVPLLIGGQVIGVINAESAKADAFNEADERLLLTIARQVAVTLERLRLLNEAQRQAAETSALLATSKAISLLKLDHVLKAIANEARKLFGADTCRIHLLEPDAKTLRCVVAISEQTEEAILNFQLRVGVGLTGRVALSGVPEIINNTLEDSRGIQIPGTPEENEAMALAPLVIRRQVIGVMTVTRKDVSRPFTSANLRLLIAFADQCAVAIDNARLFAAERRQLEELTLLNEAATASARATQEDALLDKIAQLVHRTLPHQHIGIFLLDEASGMLRPHRAYRISEGAIPRGTGVVGRVAATGQTQNVPDVSREMADKALFPGVRAELAVPVKISDQVVGVLDARSKQPAAFGEADERLLETFARQLATGLEKVRLIAAEQQRASRQQQLAKTAGTILGAHDVPELGAAVTAVAQQTLAIDRVAIFTFHDGDRMVEPLFAYNLSDAYTAAFSQNYEQTPGARLLPVVVNNVLNDAREATLRLYSRQEGFLAYAGFSLPTSHEPLGALLVYRDHLTPFNEDDIAIGQTLAYIASVAYQNILLLTEIRQALNREQRLNDITRTLNSAPDLPTVLAYVVRLAADLIEADAGLVGLVIDHQIMTFYPYNIPASISLQPTLKGSGIAWEIVENSKPIMLAHYQEHPKAQHRFVQVGARAFVGVPIMAGEECLGALQLFSFTPNKRFSHRDLALVESVGRQAGVALQNRRLFSQLSERAAALAAALARAEELDEAKNQFIQNVSHELRTPLGLIYGYAELIDSGAIGELTDGQKQSMGIIVKRVRMLTTILDDLSVLLAAETQDFRREEVHPGDLLQSVQQEFKLQAEATNITLKALIADGLPFVVGDPFHLRRVFDNLLANAFKFTPPGGTIALRVWLDGREIIFEVADTGSGIAEEEMQRIFERFYRANAGSAQHHKGKGTGLGLALVKEIVEAHQGKITVRSGLGAGTTFTIRLPAVMP
jgi:GAF domain-containing protein